MAGKNILFFSPFAALVPHSVPEARLARFLRSMGHKTEFIRCQRVLNSFCIAMSGNGLESGATQNQKDEICARCQMCSAVLSGEENPGYLLQWHDPEVAEEIRLTDSTVTTDNFLEYKYRGIPVGRYSAYESLLQFKKRSLQFSRLEFEEVRRCIKQCVVVIETLHKRYKNKIFPDVAIIYNTYYGVNAVARDFLLNANVVVKSIHAGPNLANFYDTLLIARGHNLNYYLDLKRAWKAHSIEPVTEDECAQVLAHYDELFKATSAFVYSKPSNGNANKVREFYKVPESSKIVLAAMSSDDERIAVQFVGAIDPPQDAAFPSQTDWIIHLIEFARTRPKIFLIIRVHPREFPNKREKVVAESATYLAKLFEELPSNIAVNWPEDDFSMYEVMINCDVLVTAWSSAAKEASILGIPVLTYMRGALLYPPELVETASSPSEFDIKLDQLLSKGWSMLAAGPMLHWLVNEQVRGVVRIGTNIFQNRSFALKVIEKVMREISYKLYIYWILYKPFRFDAEKVGKLVFDHPQASSPTRFLSHCDPLVLKRLRLNLIRKILGQHGARRWIDKLGAEND